MKQKVGPAAIVAAVAVLAVLMFFMYKHFFAPLSPEPSPENAPGYVKDAMKGGNTSAYGNTYGQGGQYQSKPGGPGMPMMGGAGSGGPTSGGPSTTGGPPR